MFVFSILHSPGKFTIFNDLLGGYDLLEDELRQVLCWSLGVGFPQLNIRLLAFGFVRPKFSECCRSHEELLLFTHIHTYHIYIYMSRRINNHYIYIYVYWNEYCSMYCSQYEFHLFWGSFLCTRGVPWWVWRFIWDEWRNGAWSHFLGPAM